MRPARVLLVFGTRPNIVKIAALFHAFKRREELDPVLVDTGQHRGHAMSQSLLEALHLPQPEVRLSLGESSRHQQLAEVEQGVGTALRELRPDAAIVVGDVTSTLAAAKACARRGVPVAHVEAGLRCGDWRMPEERNRVLTDRIADYLFTPSQDADRNLEAEGIEARRIHSVGNVMVDSLDWMRARICREAIARKFRTVGGEYGLVTLHRPSNVDDSQTLAGLLRALSRVGGELPLLFPVHPRTRARIQQFGLEDSGGSDLVCLPPLGYGEFVALLAEARLVVTDSGGVQEEALVLGVPCLTVRDSTERPITTRSGLNEVIGNDPTRVIASALQRLRSPGPRPSRPPGWDGRAASRIAAILARDLRQKRTVAARRRPTMAPGLLRA